MNLWILLPAFNEESSLPKLLPKIQAVMRERQLPYRVIALDDGSRDRTRALLEEYAKSMPLEVMVHPINRGLGETIRDLFERAAALAGEDDIIVRFDCDDTHDPMYIPALLDKLNQGFDVVTTSRFGEGGGQKGVVGNRAFLSRMATLYMRTFFPIDGLREFTCGFRAYRASLIKRALATYGNRFVQLKDLGFSCTLEKLVKLHMLGARFAEVPFVLRYDRKESESKMSSPVTTFGYFVLAFLYHWPWGGWKRKYRALRSA